MATNIVVMGAAGRMGTTICRMAENNSDFKLVGAVDKGERTAELSYLGVPVGESLEEILPQTPGAVIIDFTAPQASVDNSLAAAQYGNALVIGTTGLNEEQKAILSKQALSIPVFWSPNMSVGINALLGILPRLSQALGETYDIEIMEIHHHHKKDSPSGTALRLGECLAQSRSWNFEETKCCSREGLIGERPQQEIGIQSLRGGDVVGVHTVYFLGTGERIEVTHQAHSRETFAQGALRAAAWLAGQKPGKLYSMPDMLGI